MKLPKTDDKDRTHENDVNTLSWHIVNASFLASVSIGPAQAKYSGMGYSRRKNQTLGRGWGHTFFGKSPWNSLGFSLYPWKCGKIVYVTSLGNFKTKIQDSWDF